MKKKKETSACEVGHDMQVPSSDVITSLCGYSSVSEAWKVCIYVNCGASSIGDVYESLIF